MSVFANVEGNSPVSQEFIWMAEYFDGTHLSEFDLETKEENSFYDIDRERVLRFGLIGHGMKLFHEYSGRFNLNGNGISIEYEDEYGTLYPLTGHSGKYTDIITYKDAESALKLDGSAQSRINKFNFGYKTELLINDTTIQFKAICTVPFNEPAYMNFRVVADKAMNGKLRVKKNNQMTLEIEAPLDRHKGGEVNVKI